MFDCCLQRKKKQSHMILHVVAGRVRQVVVLYSNDCMGICLCGLTIGRLGRVVSYRGGCLNRFDCIYKVSVNTTTNKYYYGTCKNTFVRTNTL